LSGTSLSVFVLPGIPWVTRAQTNIGQKKCQGLSSPRSEEREERGIFLLLRASPRCVLSACGKLLRFGLFAHDKVGGLTLIGNKKFSPGKDRPGASGEQEHG
jgi:hypothetical protein